jgi:outer membrane protein assembly factor BamB
MVRGVALLAFTLFGCVPVSAEDWPQWMGQHRDANWTETGIVDQLPGGTLTPKWTAPVGGGYAGPAVANGRVFVPDRILAKGQKNPDDPFDTMTVVKSTERLVCLDAKTGKELWKHEYDCPYRVSYPAGPRCTPTAHEGKVYHLGTMGHLVCYAANDGTVLWQKSFTKDFQAKVPTWGFCGHPLVYQNLLICIVGGENALVVAFDKSSGEVKWKKHNASEPGYSPPTLISHGGVDELLIWDADKLSGLNPKTGDAFWRVPLKPDYGMSIMAPQKAGDHLFAAGIGNHGSLLKLTMTDGKPAVEPVWTGSKDRGLYPVNMTPLIHDGVIYGVDRPGMFRAVRLETGARLWHTFKPVLNEDHEEDYKQAGSGTAFMVRHGERFVLFNEKGTLIFAKLTPNGYEAQSDAKLLEPSSAAFGRKVLWTHPAFAEKCVFVRNDEKIACYSLAK